MARHSSAHDAFTRADRRRLARALATTSAARVYRRVAAVLAVADGATITAAARAARVDRVTVHRWVDRYLAARHPGGLADDSRRGRPRRPAPTARQLTALLARDPRALGYHAATWTAPMVAHYCAARLGCVLTPRTVRRRLHALGYRWKRPRYRYAHRATHLAQKKGLSAVA